MKTGILKWAKHSKELKSLTALHSNSIPWSEVHPETLGVGVWQIGRDSSLNLAASSVLIFSLTGHCSPENSEAKACVFATGCFSVTETPSGMSEASSSVRKICFVNHLHHHP